VHGRQPLTSPQVPSWPVRHLRAGDRAGPGERNVARSQRRRRQCSATTWRGGGDPRQTASLHPSQRVAAGARINQAVLARDLQVSRGHVCEALRLLQSEGLVEHIHQQQMRVSPVSLADLEQLYAMRISVEAFAAARTVRRLTMDELNVLESALGRMDDEAAAGDIDRWEAIHGGFQAQLVAHVEIASSARCVTSPSTALGTDVSTSKASHEPSPKEQRNMPESSKLRSRATQASPRPGSESILVGRH
jgi:DNA-binding transcriptional regulator YhcF (GntR family)